MTTNKKLAIAGVLFLGLLAGLFLSGCGTTSMVPGTVIEKTHTPSSTSIGVGGKHTKVYYTPEKYTLLVQTDVQSGAVDVKADVYVRVKVGDRVQVRINSVWGILDVQP